ncbi:nuclear receptor corepressor 1, partial [Pseudonaja textilis]|uniref:nuclear receptor corepressor 1 n=1 Tax=Pseudonaja textilis TaxID=8673 RepID=UPI000EA8D431
MAAAEEEEVSLPPPPPLVPPTPPRNCRMRGITAHSTWSAAMLTTRATSANTENLQGDNMGLTIAFYLETEFAVPDFRTSHLEVGQGSQLLQQQQQQLRRRPSLLSEFHPGSDRPQERRSGYESQFHAGPSQADHDALDSKRPRLDQVSDSHYQRVSATAVLPLAHQLQEGLRSSDLKKVKPVGLTGGAETFRKKAEEAHKIFEGLGPKVELPLYNQPSDTKVYHENIKTNQVMRKKLILFFKRRNHARKQREQKICQRYDQLMEAWEKKVDRIENNPRRKAKESKTREYYEKQFPEIRKQREQQERFQRVGQRGTGLSATIARSEHEISEIIDGLSEQENNEKQMRQLSVIPPMMFDAEQRRVKFINMNGLMEDPMKVYKDRQFMNVWTDHEKEIFKEKFVQHPKNFGLIASYLERKNVPDCVLYYYLTKKNENYKALVRRNYGKRRGRNQ